MTKVVYVLALLILFSCEGKSQLNSKLPVTSDSLEKENSRQDKIDQFVNRNPDNGKTSQSMGTVSDGKLVNGKLMPFQGANFRYFDTLSYLSSRGFVNDKVKRSTLQTYTELAKDFPQRNFFIMECSNKNGGKIFPHRTHQNGLSIDFMVPLIKNNEPCYELDTIGASHYWLEFDNTGKYSKDKTISIDFNLIACHILELEKQARLNSLKISKVIIKTELIDELYSSKNGHKLKNSGIYVAQKLTPLINSLHDDHYHIDFEIIK
jgi:penicillin-insensitive murein endopeptidase